MNRKISKDIKNLIKFFIFLIIFNKFKIFYILDRKKYRYVTESHRECKLFTIIQILQWAENWELFVLARRRHCIGGKRGEITNKNNLGIFMVGKGRSKKKTQGGNFKDGWVCKKSLHEMKATILTGDYWPCLLLLLPSFGVSNSIIFWLFFHTFLST